MTVATLFTSDSEHFEGVRPINIWMLRVFHFLMAAFVATEAWRTLLPHVSPWDHVRAVAGCVWATYPTLAVLGLIHSLAKIFLWTPVLMAVVPWGYAYRTSVKWPAARSTSIASRTPPATQSGRAARHE